MIYLPLCYADVIRYIPNTFYKEDTKWSSLESVDLSFNGIYRLHPAAFTGVNLVTVTMETQLDGNKLTCNKKSGSLNCACKNSDWALTAPGTSGFVMQANDVLTTFNGNYEVNANNGDYYCTNIEQCGQNVGISGYQKTYRSDKLKDESQCIECPLNSRTADDECYEGSRGGSAVGRSNYPVHLHESARGR